MGYPSYEVRFFQDAKYIVIAFKKNKKDIFKDITREALGLVLSYEVRVFRTQKHKVITLKKQILNFRDVTVGDPWVIPLL